MKKFTCGHCGGRIAIQPRHMGKMVVCPDCGKPTHPLAGEILAAAKDGSVARSASAAPVARKCENCGRSIGRLEKLELWENHLVCQACKPLLAPAKPRAAKKAAAEREVSTPAAHEIVVLPREEAPIRSADRSPRAAIGAGPISVSVSRVGSAAAGLRAPMRHKLLVLIAALFIAGAAMYGLLMVLRDLMWILTTIALAVMGVGVVAVLLRFGHVYFARKLSAWRSRRVEARSATTAIISSPQSK